MKKNQIIALSLAAVLLVALSAGASAYLTKENIQDHKVVTTSHKKIVPKPNDIAWNDNQPQRAVQVQPACDDGNIAGKAVGGIGGGVLGSMLGNGKGKTATTIAGTLGGAYVGGEAIPLRNATCRK